MSISEARSELAESVNRVHYRHERVVIERHGKEMAAIVPIEDLRLIEAIEDRIDIADARRALAEEGAVDLDDIKGELGLS